MHPLVVCTSGRPLPPPSPWCAPALLCLKSQGGGFSILERSSSQMAQELVCLKGKIVTDLENVFHVRAWQITVRLACHFPLLVPPVISKKKRSLWGNPPQIAILLACCNYLDLFKFQSEWALLCLFHFCLLWPGKVSHLSSCHLANGVCPSCIHSRVAGFR